MRGPKIADGACFAAFVALALGSAACSSDHHVSPWGDADSPTLRPFVPKPDLAAHLDAIDAETSELRLTRTSEIAGELPNHGGALVVRGYEGQDVGGRAVHAVRVATGRGVVMAVGPLDTRDLARDRATELLPTLVASSTGDAYRSGSDVNGDGSPDVVLRSETGALEIWAIAVTGASPYSIEMAARPTRADDVDGDGHLDLVGQLPALQGDSIQPRLEDAGVFVNGRYTNDADGARAFHKARIEAIDAVEAVEASERAKAADAADAGVDAGPAPKPIADEVRLKRALERAWNGILSGKPREAEMKALDREIVPLAFRVSFLAHRTSVEALLARTRSGR